MKRYITGILLLAAIICTAANSVQVRLRSSIIKANEPAILELRASGAESVQFAEMPQVEGLKWLRNTGSRQYTYSVNGRRYSNVEQSYMFVAEKSGTYTIPATWVYADNKKVKTKPFTFKVGKGYLESDKAANGELNINKLIFSKVIIPGDKKNYYVGEYIPVEIKVFISPELKIMPELRYPEISVEKGETIFRNYQDVNPGNPQFDRPRRGVEYINGEEYACFVFRTEFKALSAGNLTLKSQIQSGIKVLDEQSRRTTNDPYFGNYSRYSYRTLIHALLATSPVLNIKQLPAPPQGSQYIGLNGNWDVYAELSAKEVKVGNAITLTINISGTSGLENLRPPELKLKDFRVYSPEISKGSESAAIRYTLIPLKAGSLPLSLSFCTFNTQTGKYETSEISETIQVSTNQGIVPASHTPNVVDAAMMDNNAPKDEKHQLAGIMYLKRLREDDTAQNNYFRGWIIGILCIGILAVIICEILAFFFRGTTESAKRRADAAKQKKILLGKMNDANSSQIYDLAPEISEYINNALDLSPGTSLNESAEWIAQKNPDLSGELKKLSAGAWTPGAEEFSEERKIKLMKMLKKLVCISLLMLTAFLSAAEQSQDEIIKAYDAGNFKEAREWYTGKLERQGVTPALLYNIGNCYYQEKDFAKALFCYERAHLLAPRDVEILRNLELTRRELNLPAVSRLNKPSDIPVFLRDQMTPEEWMILGAVGLSLLLIAFGLRRFSGIRVTLPVAIIGAVILLLGTAMTISQKQTNYNPERAIILENGIQLRTLPSEKSPVLNDEKLAEAEKVLIRERRDKWIRIKAGDAIGWVPAEAVGQLNGGKFSVF